MIIGFTGSRNKMNRKQISELKSLLSSFSIEEFHHGDCVGSDKQANDIIKAMKILKDQKSKIVLHPPKYKKYRAYCRADISHKPEAYLIRNRQIVDATEILVATPCDKEKLRSGTWSTVRYARKLKKLIYIIMPDGQVIKEND